VNSSVSAKRHPLLDPRILLRGLVLIATLVAVGWLLEVIGLKSMLDTGWIDHEVRGKGLWGEALFVLVGAAFTVVLPRQVVSFLGGYAFGFVIGTGLALLATLVSAVTSFYYARFMGRDFLARRYPGRIGKIDAFLSTNTLVTTLVLRLSPFSSNLIANLAAGVSGVRPAPFFAGSAIGYLPQTLIFALLGSGFDVDPTLRTGLSVALFVVSSVLGLVLWRRYRAKRGMPDEESGAEGEGAE